MNLREGNTEIQKPLGEYCRTGVELKIPGVTPGRVHHYRRLVYNVVRDTLDTAYPITLCGTWGRAWELWSGLFRGRTSPDPPDLEIAL